VDAYLTAEGIFTGIGIPEDVHLRARNPKKEGKALAASRAPITFWQARSRCEIYTNCRHTLKATSGTAKHSVRCWPGRVPRRAGSGCHG